MVTVRMFIPYMNAKSRFEMAVNHLGPQDDVRMELLHMFDTPELLSRYRDTDILVARDMIYDRLRYLFPEKRMVEIQLPSFDILKALICTRQEFHPKKIALCMRYTDENAVSELEKLCQVEIACYAVHDEASTLEAIHSAGANGTDAFVGADTVCGPCDKEALNQIHIHTKDITIERALKQTIDAAKTTNMGRARSKMTNTTLNTSSDALITVSSSGLIQVLDSQAYRTLQLSSQADYTGRPVGEVYPAFKRRDVVETGREREEVIQWKDRKLYTEYKPVLVDKIGKGATIITRYTEQIIEAKAKTQQSLAKRGLTAKYSFDDIIGNSPAIRENILVAEHYSRVDSNVLIMGETRTGKELFAHSIHREGRHSAEPFVALNYAALPENLLESELFGYGPKTFSGASKSDKTGLFELAHEGTISLDEIRGIPISLQAELLKVLQEQETRHIDNNRVQPADMRIISATNINIEEKIQEGQFHADLYYRLNLLDITIPPLGERGGDIREMANFYLTRFACEVGEPVPRLSKETVDLMAHYGWPGNVRELRNTYERLIVLSDTAKIGLREIQMPRIFKEKEGPLPGTQAPNKEADQSETETMYANLKSRKKKQGIAEELGVDGAIPWRMGKMARE